MYAAAKHIHLLAVVISILLFIVRFVLLAANKPAGNHKALRVIPHIAYTILILSAGWLCSILNMYPFVTPWVTNKLIGLVLFIVCALWATQWAKSIGMKSLAFILALSALGMTLHVAISKQALLF